MIQTVTDKLDFPSKLMTFLMKLLNTLYLKSFNRLVCQMTFLTKILNELFYNE